MSSWFNASLQEHKRSELYGMYLLPYHPVMKPSGLCHNGELVTTRDGRPLAGCVRQSCLLPEVKNGSVHLKPPGVIMVRAVLAYILYKVYFCFFQLSV